MKIFGGCSNRRSSQSQRRIHWRVPWDFRMYTSLPTHESACGKRGKWLRVEQEPSKWLCSLSDPSPTYSTTMQWSGLPRSGEYLGLLPLQCKWWAETKNYGPNGRTHQNPRKRTKRRVGSQLIRCRVQNTGSGYSQKWLSMIKNKGRSEGYTKWNKLKYTGNQQQREWNWDSNQLFGTNQRNKHSARTEWRIKNSKKWGES